MKICGKNCNLCQIVSLSIWNTSTGCSCFVCTLNSFGSISCVGIAYNCLFKLVFPVACSILISLAVYVCHIVYKQGGCSLFGSRCYLVSRAVLLKIENMKRERDEVNTIPFNKTSEGISLRSYIDALNE